MTPKLEALELIESEFSRLDKSYKRRRVANNIYESIQLLLDFSKDAVLTYNLNLSRNCFSLIKRVLTIGDKKIKDAVERSFIRSFAPFEKRGDLEIKRLKFFVPEDFYNIFLKRVQKQNFKIAEIPKKGIDQANITVRRATKADHIFAKQIVAEMHSSAIVRGGGISKRSPISVIRKMVEGKAIIAVTADEEWVGFSYLETYENDRFVSNSGLIVAPGFRNLGVANLIKSRIFELSRSLYPKAKIFSITTGGAVMKMNTRLGFEPVPYSDITTEQRFWKGCKSCVNYEVLQRKDFKNCLCTAMVFVPGCEEPQEEENESETEH